MAKKATGMGGCDHTKGGSNASRSDCTRVAMVQNLAALSQQGNAMIHQPLGEQTILVMECSGNTSECVNINRTGGSKGRLHPVEGPAKVDGGWS
jgi:hypothetical protein